MLKQQFLEKCPYKIRPVFLKYSAIFIVKFDKILETYESPKHALDFYLVHQIILFNWH